MKQSTSVLHLMLRAAAVPTGILCALLVLGESIVCFLVYPQSHSMSFLFDCKLPLLIFSAAIMLLTCLLCRTGTGRGSNPGLTVQRLSVSEQQVFLLQTGCNLMMYLLLCLVQALLLVCLALIETPSNPRQFLFLLFHESAFAHTFFPFRDIFLWVSNFVLLLTMSLAAAHVPYSQRRGKHLHEILLLLVLLPLTVHHKTHAVAQNIIIVTLCLIICYYTLYCVFGLVLALYLAVFFWINSGTDQVLFTEEPLSGSPSAANGLTIRYHSTFHEQHYWDSEFTLPAYQDAHTDYSYRPDGRPLPDDPKEPLVIDNQVSQGYVTVPSELEEPYQSLSRLAVRQPDTEVMQTFSLADYVDHYPLNFCFSFSNMSQESLAYDSGFTYPGNLENPNSKCLAPLAHAFPIPVPAEETFTWSMIADGDGNIRYFHFNPIADQRPADASPVPSAFYRMQCFSVRADDTIYFCINSKSQSGRVMDFSQLPLGYGLYALPLRPIDANPKWLPVSEELSMIHPLDPNMDLISLSLSPDSQQLLLFAVENGSYTVTVLDLSGTVLQTLPMAPCADGLMGGELVDCGDYLVALLKDADRLAVLSRTADGSLQLDFTCPFHPDSWQDSDLTLSDAAMAYDGTRLALAYPSPGSRQFFVDIYTADGLACSAKYSTSLYKVSCTSPFGSCHGTEDALSLSWN